MKSKSADGSLLEYISFAIYTLLYCNNLESLPTVPEDIFCFEA